MDVDYYLSKHWSLDYDCWSLVREFYLRELNVQLPEVAVRADDLRECMQICEQSAVRDLFERIDEPQHGCVVEMGGNQPFHVGICLQVPETRILHNLYTAGVVCEPKPPFDVLGYYAYREPSSQPA